MLCWANVECAVLFCSLKIFFAQRVRMPDAAVRPRRQGKALKEMLCFPVFACIGVI
jgi:hypothetical protein